MQATNDEGLPEGTGCARANGYARAWMEDGSAIDFVLDEYEALVRRLDGYDRMTDGKDCWFAARSLYGGRLRIRLDTITTLSECTPDVLRAMAVDEQSTKRPSWSDSD